MEQKIAGYRELSEKQVILINEVKNLEAQVMDAIITSIQEGCDNRMASIAKTDFQKGFMCLNRAIARPEGY